MYSSFSCSTWSKDINQKSTQYINSKPFGIFKYYRVSKIKKKLKNLFMLHQVLFMVIQKYIRLLKMILKIYPNQYMEQLSCQMKSSPGRIQ